MRLNIRKGSATIEYIALATFLITAFLVISVYLFRGMVGRWKSVGETAGQGLYYDPKDTTLCNFDYVYTSVWYNVACYEENCDCESVAQTFTTCQACIIGCRTSYCD